jgi:hypothetical protein
MDHRWDESVRHDRERERYGARSIEPDPDVERRDRSVLPRPQQSPWAIGLAHYDQRDLYTRDARTDAAGYGRGPSYHPEEGSYAYPRAFPPRRPGPHLDATQFEREAWPWLNYHDIEDDPFQRGLHAEAGFWARLRERAHAVRERLGGHRTGPKNYKRSDQRIREDVCDLLTFDGAIDASDIDVVVEDAEVTLNGTVPDRAMKKMAERCAERVRGVRDVHNRLVVRPEDPSTTSPVFAVPLAFMGR